MNGSPNRHRIDPDADLSYYRNITKPLKEGKDYKLIRPSAFEDQSDGQQPKRYDPKTGEEISGPGTPQKAAQGMSKKIQQLTNLTHYAKIAKLVNQFEMAGSERDPKAPSNKPKKRKFLPGQPIPEDDSDEDETRHLPPTEAPFANNFKKLVNYPTPSEIAGAELRLNDGPAGDKFALEKSLESIEKPIEEVPEVDIMKFHQQQTKRMMLNPAYAAEALQGLKVPARSDRDFGEEVKVAVGKEATKIQRGISEQEWDKPLRLRDFYQNLQKKKSEASSNSKIKGVAEALKSPRSRTPVQSQQDPNDYAPVVNLQDGKLNTSASSARPWLHMARPMVNVSQAAQALARQSTTRGEYKGGSPTSGKRQVGFNLKSDNSPGSPENTRKKGPSLPAFSDMISHPKSLLQVSALLHRLQTVRENSRPFMQTGIRVDWSDPFSRFGQNSRYIGDSQGEESENSEEEHLQTPDHGIRASVDGETATQPEFGTMKRDNSGELRPRVEKYLENYQSGKLKSNIVGLDQGHQSNSQLFQNSTQGPGMSSRMNQNTQYDRVISTQGEDRQTRTAQYQEQRETSDSTPIRSLYLMLDLLFYTLGLQKIPFRLVKDASEMARVGEQYLKWAYEEDYGWCDRMVRMEQDLKRAQVTLEGIAQERNVMGRAARELGYMKWLREKVLNWMIKLEDSGLLEDEEVNVSEQPGVPLEKFSSFSRHGESQNVTGLKNQTSASLQKLTNQTSQPGLGQRGQQQSPNKENVPHLANRAQGSANHMGNPKFATHASNANLSTVSINQLSPIKPILKKSPGRSMSRFMEDTPNKSTRSTSTRRTKHPEYPTIPPAGRLHSAWYYSLEKAVFPSDVPSVRRKVPVQVTHQAKLQLKVPVTHLKVLTSTLVAVVLQNITGVYILELKTFTEVKVIATNAPVSNISPCRLLDQQEEDERVCQKYLIVGTSSGQVMICSLYSLDVVAVFQAHLKPVVTLFDTCYGKGVVSADGFANLRVWNVGLGRKVDLSQSFSATTLIHDLCNEKLLDNSLVSTHAVCMDHFAVVFPRGILLFKTKESVVNTITVECVSYFRCSLMGNPRVFNASSAMLFFMDGIFYEYVLYDMSGASQTPKLLALHRTKDSFGAYTQMSQTVVDGFDLITDPNSMLKVRRKLQTPLIPEESESGCNQSQVVFSGIEDEFMTMDNSPADSSIAFSYKEPKDRS